MPCSDYPPDCSSHDEGTPDEIERLERRNDDLANMLCEAMTVIEPTGRIPTMVSAHLRNWWEAHKAKDAQDRRVREDRRRVHLEQKMIRNRALSKLTPDERQALGLR